MNRLLQAVIALGMLPLLATPASAGKLEPARYCASPDMLSREVVLPAYRLTLGQTGQSLVYHFIVQQGQATFCDAAGIALEPAPDVSGEQAYVMMIRYRDSIGYWETVASVPCGDADEVDFQSSGGPARISQSADGQNFEIICPQAIVGTQGGFTVTELSPTGNTISEASTTFNLGEATTCVACTNAEGCACLGPAEPVPDLCNDTQECCENAGCCEEGGGPCQITGQPAPDAGACTPCNDPAFCACDTTVTLPQECTDAETCCTSLSGDTMGCFPADDPPPVFQPIQVQLGQGVANTAEGIFLVDNGVSTDTGLPTCTTGIGTEIVGTTMVVSCAETLWVLQDGVVANTFTRTPAVFQSEQKLTLFGDLANGDVNIVYAIPSDFETNASPTVVGVIADALNPVAAVHEETFETSIAVTVAPRNADASGGVFDVVLAATDGTIRAIPGVATTTTGWTTVASTFTHTVTVGNRVGENPAGMLVMDPQPDLTVPPDYHLYAVVDDGGGPVIEDVLGQSAQLLLPYPSSWRMNTFGDDFFLSLTPYVCDFDCTNKECGSSCGISCGTCPSGSFCDDSTPGLIACVELPECGNGIVEFPEECDPPESCGCPLDDDPCMAPLPITNPEPCRYTCELNNAPEVDQCIDNDGCCPSTVPCDVEGDSDCDGPCLCPDGSLCNPDGSCNACQCPIGLTCDSGGACEPAPFCTDKTDCPQGWECIDLPNTPVGDTFCYAPYACTGQADCEFGLVCDASTSLCLPSPPCAVDGDCPVPLTCLPDQTGSGAPGTCWDGP